jgi:TolA-binding protein
MQLMPVLTLVWNGFIKPYWKIIAVVAVLGTGYAWFKHHESQGVATIVAINASHQQEIDQINKARQDEETQHQQELQQLQMNLTQIQQRYDAAQAALQAQQQQEQVQIVKKYGTNPVELAQLVAGKFGFVVQSSPQ